MPNFDNFFGITDEVSRLSVAIVNGSQICDLWTGKQNWYGYEVYLLMLSSKKNDFCVTELIPYSPYTFLKHEKTLENFLRMSVHLLRLIPLNFRLLPSKNNRTLLASSWLASKSFKQGGHFQYNFRIWPQLQQRGSFPPLVDALINWKRRLINKKRCRHWQPDQTKNMGLHGFGRETVQQQELHYPSCESSYRSRTCRAVRHVHFLSLPTSHAALSPALFVVDKHASYSAVVVTAVQQLHQLLLDCMEFLLGKSGGPSRG